MIATNTISQTKRFPVCCLVFCFLIFSCKTFKIQAPDTLSENSEKLHVKGVHISIFSHKVHVGGYGYAQMHSGFTSEHQKKKRLYPLYFDIDNNLRYISNHFGKVIDESKTKFSFDFSTKEQTCRAYCFIKSMNTSIKMLPSRLSIPTTGEYDFNGALFLSKQETPWFLSFHSYRSITKNATDFVRNMNNSDGVLTDNNNVIEIKLIKSDVQKEDSKTKSKAPFKLAVGYELRSGNHVFGFVDVIDNNIWIDKAVDEKMKTLLISAGICILVKSQA